MTVAKLMLDEDFAAMAADDAQRWRLERKGDLQVWVTLSPEGHEQEVFTARLAWTKYSDDWPPSVLFVDPATGAVNVPSAWPTGQGFRPPNDICANWTSEGFVTHPEWKADPTKRLNMHGNPLRFIVVTLQHELDCHFTGRFAPRC